MVVSHKLLVYSLSTKIITSSTRIRCLSINKLKTPVLVSLHIHIVLSDTLHVVYIHILSIFNMTSTS